MKPGFSNSSGVPRSEEFLEALSAKSFRCIVEELNILVLQPCELLAFPSLADAEVTQQFRICRLPKWDSASSCRIRFVQLCNRGNRKCFGRSCCVICCTVLGVIKWSGEWI